MRLKSSFTSILLLISLVVSPDLGPFLAAQTALSTPQELDQLLAPVALYPDSLLAQITTASTNPQEILDVDNWLQENQGLTGTALTDAAQQQGFDPAFIALVNFPQVLEMMAQHIDDYAAIGQAFSADQEAVSASVQRLRAQAYAAGSLRSTSEQQVLVQQPAGQTIYVIQPASPQVVYVPQYDPAVVYVAPSTNAVVVASLISFGAGIGIGALLVDNRPWGWGGWGWNWGSRRVYYNQTWFGVVGRILIGRHASGIARDRSYGPTVRAIAAIGAIVREIIVLLILQVTVPATVVRLTDQAIRRVTTGREIVPARRVVHQFNHPGRERLAS
jgi:hypothetical protein